MYRGSEHHLLGLSPQYWSNTPLLISDLLSLELINGVDCLISHRSSNTTAAHTHQAQSETTPTTRHILPLSRCELIGTVVNVKLRPKGCTMYVLDDGTGIVDCVKWVESHEDDFYRLPSLDDDDHLDHTAVTLGDTVRVIGKIRCVSTETDGDSNRVVREVNITDIETIRNQPNCEALHFLRCMHQQKTNLNQPQTNNNSNNIVRNGAQVLQLLNPNLVSTIITPPPQSTDQDIDSQFYHLYGHKCQCYLPYQQDQLLYCHCNATIEPLDPDFTFRDALLQQLLQMEQQQQQQQQTQRSQPLYFCYKTVLQNSQLTTVATQTIQSNNSNKRQLDPILNTKRLFCNTFQALRRDGILFLTNAEKDEYLFLTKERVLEPYVRDVLDSSTLYSQVAQRLNVPEYLEHVPRKRLRVVKRGLKQMEREEDEEEDEEVVLNEDNI